MDDTGNPYLADVDLNRIVKWTAATGTISTWVGAGTNGPEFSVLADPTGVAVTDEGSVYVSNSQNDTVKVRRPAFVNPPPRTEVGEAGESALPSVLPSYADLAGPFAPIIDQLWLTVGGVSNGVVKYSFTANTPGQVQFRSAPTSRTPNGFYRVRSP